jgi:hypothetical protein
MSTTDSTVIQTPHQPVLPAEVRFTEAEFIFMDESPAGLFPENQNSNFGFIIRKIFCDLAQNISDWQNTLYNEKFVETSTQFLDQWEIEVGLPPNPADQSISDRRANVLSRLQHGPFTRTRRKNIVERYVRTTFGNPIQLVPAGVAMVSGGVPIYGESGDVSTLYLIVENIPGFSYLVWIASTNTPDLVALTAELKRITPAGISFTITNVHP